MKVSYSWSFACCVLLIYVWMPVVISRGVPEMQLGIEDETDFNDYEQTGIEELFEADVPLSSDEEVPTPIKRLAPDYYRQQCNEHKPCPSGQYCDMFLCVKCFGENTGCCANGQCCRGQCTYGRCKGSSFPGDDGTFCNRHTDCKGDSCCVREPFINTHISVCKPPLEEHMVCGPINFFKNVYVGAQVQETCGPCRKGLVCKHVGLFGIHETCVPK